MIIGSNRHSYKGKKEDDYRAPSEELFPCYGENQVRKFAEYLFVQRRDRPWIVSWLR